LDLSNLVLLVIPTTNCTPCLKELNWWNTKGKEFTHRRIDVVVLAKYTVTFHAFVKKYLGNLTAFRDSSFLIIQKQLIPVPPVKIYFNGESKLADIQKIGAHGKLYTFVKKARKE